jgi:hypothetical protein
MAPLGFASSSEVMRSGAAILRNYSPHSVEEKGEARMILLYLYREFIERGVLGVSASCDI